MGSGLDTVGGSLVGIWKSKARSSIILLCLAMVLCQVVACCFQFWCWCVVVFTPVGKMFVSVHKEGGQQRCLLIYQTPLWLGRGELQYTNCHHHHYHHRCSYMINVTTIFSGRLLRVRNSGGPLWSFWHFNSLSTSEPQALCRWLHIGWIQQQQLSTYTSLMKTSLNQFDLYSLPRDYGKP